MVNIPVSYITEQTNIFLETLVFELGILIVLLIILRITYLIHKITRDASLKISEKRRKPVKVLIVIGSGGHTTEMLSLVKTLDITKYSPRFYVLALNDTTSEKKVQELEHNWNKDKSQLFRLIYIPRSRMVHQTYFTSIFTTVYSILRSLPVVIKTRPDLILCNGPGTCISICLASFILRCLFIVNTKIIFIESFCRTKTLSLTGKILLYFADNILVQWPKLKTKYSRVEYIGQLM